MKSSLETLAAVAPSAPWARAADFFELTKPRITLLILITTMVGFYLGAAKTVSLLLLLNTLFGTALVAGGASALNMYLERDLDALMSRTLRRPLPSGRLQSREVLAFALLISTAGALYLLIFVNLIASLISVITLLSYNFLYTPLKNRTWLATLIGAAPGAFPAVLGWAAATGDLALNGWIVFGIVFFWQIPHFYAIGWMYREEYGRAGFIMLPVVDKSGLKTSRQATFFIISLILISTLPFLRGIAGSLYLGGAILLGCGFLICGLAFLHNRDHKAARKLFLASICYLPALLAILMIDQVVP